MESSVNEDSELLLNDTADAVLEDIQDFDDSLFELDEEALEAVDDEDGESLDDTNDDVGSVTKSKNKHSGSELFQCVECAYTTTNYSRYKKHVQYHSMPLIKCDQCEFRTPYKWNLDRHMRNHNEDGQFKCNRCSFSANIKQSLSFHVQNHHLPSSTILQRFKAKNNRGGSHSISMFKDLDNTEEELETDIVLTDLPSDDHLESNDDIEDESATPNDKDKISISKAVKKHLSLPSDVSIKCIEKNNDFRLPNAKKSELRESKNSDVTGISGKSSASKSDKTAAKRPPPCLIPLSKHGGIAAESTGKTEITPVADSNGMPSTKSAVHQSTSVLDRLFNKKMAASSVSESGASKGEMNLSELTVKPVNVQSSSNRCPYCRHRCKTTDDLRTHKKTCLQAPQSLEALLDGEKTTIGNDEREDDEILILDERNPNKSSDQSRSLPKSVTPPSAFASGHHTGSSIGDEYSLGGRNSNSTYNLVRRRVFKCPHCPFWATTASRFHVHLVGHMNMRPYECSICSYRSNWRWDITKHIRLKSSRDSSHNRAKLIIREEGNMRDYDRYDEYLVVMDVEEGLQCKPQEALLSKKSRVSPPSPGLSGIGNSISDVPPPGIPPAGLFGSGIGMIPMPSSDSMFRGMPLLPPPTRFVLPIQPGVRPPMLNSLRLPQVQSVRLPSMPGMMGMSPFFFNSDMTVTKVPSVASPSSMVDRFSDPINGPRDITLTPSLESLKQMDPSLAAMGLTSENTAIVLPEPPPDAQSSGKKSTVWRCKKCPFKHRDKRAMLAHVALHSSVEQYNCGHCGKPSNSESVLRRHCRNKHGGVISIVENKSQKAGADRSLSSSDVLQDPAPRADVCQCPLCPFTSVGDETGEEMRSHMGHHAPAPGSALKCTECPYYVSTKKALVEHMTLHGVVSPVKDIKSKNEGPLNLVRVGEPVKQDRNAPYRCLHCAFSTHMKTQLLSHRQFHALRHLPYQCPCCTFNVNQRSQMAEHVKVHGLRCKESRASSAEATSPPADASRDSSATPVRISSSPAKPASRASPAGSVYSLMVGDSPAAIESLPRLSDAQTARLTFVPLVWASRGERLFRAYKCRRCPHLSVVRAYIEQHERLHERRDSSFAQQCGDCGYVAITAAVLAGHRRVHQHSLGRIHALVSGQDQDQEHDAPSESEQLKQLLPEEQRARARVKVVGVGGARIQPRSASPHSQEADSGSVVADSDYRSQENTAAQDGGASGSVTPASDRTLYFCQRCPARFFHEKEIAIHTRFHGMNLPYGCDQCTYMARQQSHLLAHFKVHSGDYHRRTRSLLSLYGHAQSHPPRADQRATSRTDNAPENRPEGKRRSFAAVSASDGRSSPVQYTRSGFVRRFSCPRCPARFVKEVTLRYHLTLHGSDKPFGCPYCDYAVKAQSHLMKHLSVHEKQNVVADDRVGDDVSDTRPSDAPSADDFPMSGVDLLKRKMDFEREQQQKQVGKGAEGSPRKTMRLSSSMASAVVSPERAGNPNFEYPTVTDKMGRERPRRYKCPKCPSAFEKRDQFFNHLGLHGARNRYRCTVCDYSVKFWANYLVHMRCHGIPAPKPAEAESHQQSHLAAADAKMQGESETAGGAASAAPLTNGKLEDADEAGQKRLSLSSADQLPPELSDAEKQQLILQQLRAEQDGAKDEGESGRRWNRCQFCPYASTRRDHTENHRWRHAAFGARGTVPCRFCDYVGFQGHLMREHHRLHFLPARQLARADSFTQLVQLQVYVKEVADTASEDEMGACFEDVDTSTHNTLFDAEAEGVGLDRIDDNEVDVNEGSVRARVLVDMSTGDVIGELSDISEKNVAAADAKTDTTNRNPPGHAASESYGDTVEENDEEDPPKENTDQDTGEAQEIENLAGDVEQEEDGMEPDDGMDSGDENMVAVNQDEYMNEDEIASHQGDDILDNDEDMTDLLGPDDEVPDQEEDMEGQERFAEEDEDASDEDAENHTEDGDDTGDKHQEERSEDDEEFAMNQNKSADAERTCSRSSEVESPRSSRVASPPAAMTAV